MRALRLALVFCCAAAAGCGGHTKTTGNTIAQPANGPATAPSTATKATTPQAPKRPVKLGSPHAAVPILMYHVLGTPPASAPLPELWVSVDNFHAQMDALAAAGYEPVTLKTVFDAWHGGGDLPAKPVVLSFDDGYLADALVAAPTLRRHGWPGVLNLEINDLGKDGLPRHLAQKMSDRDGWEIDSHTITHPDLTTVGDAQLKTELTISRQKIKQLLGADARFFCYPAGKFDARVQAAVKAAGYRAATTELPGIAKPSDDPYALPRLRITNADTGPALLARLKGK